MAHPWRFFRAGGFDQVRLDTGADFAALATLDPKLWVALSCPTRGLEFDTHTLDLLDADKDGRVRVPEVIEAARWTTSLLKNADELAKGSGELPLDSINGATDEGRQVLASAKQLLANLGKGEARSVSPGDTTDTVKIFSKTVFNGDGIIPPESAGSDLATQQVIRDAIASLGAAKDLSGLDGVDQPKLDQFFKEAGEFVEWWKKSEGDEKVLPLKDATPAAFAACQAVRTKIDDFFARCGLAAMDGRATASLNPSDAEYVAMASKELSAANALLLGLPLAHIEPNRALPLSTGLNPAWAGPIATFRDACVKPLLGEQTSLTVEQWNSVAAKLAAHAAWSATKPAGSVEKLGPARLKELVAGKGKANVEVLLARDKALEPELKAITSVDRLAHYYRDLAAFLNNFVAFRDFYTRRGKAMFQAGTLYLDGRSCELCMRVDDAAKHGALAGLSMAYLAYCDLTRKGSTEKLHVVAAFTGGDSDFLMVGRNGIFYDRKGQDWDATITKVVEQPISVRQAFWSPYKKLARFISDQIQKFASAKDKASEGHLTGAVGEAAKADAKKEPTAFDVGKFAGIFAAIGLAVGTIGTAAAALATGFVSLKAWQMPLAVAGGMLIISGPAMLLAAMKLRQRNLGPLLDASGWAINARARINIPFGGSLTHLATLPPGSQRSMIDPYADKKRPWGFYLVIAALLGALAWAWQTGRLQPLVLKVMGNEPAATDAPKALSPPSPAAEPAK